MGEPDVGLLGLEGPGNLLSPAPAVMWLGSTAHPGALGFPGERGVVLPSRPGR